MQEKNEQDLTLEHIKKLPLHQVFLRHSTYGVGLYAGIISNADGEEFIKLKYAHNTYIYLPILSVSLLQIATGYNQEPNVCTLKKISPHRFSTGEHHMFLMNNRKNLIIKAIELSYQLQDSEEFQNKIREINTCSRDTNDVLRWAEATYTNNQPFLNPLRQAIQEEKKLSQTRARDYAHSVFHLTYMLTFISFTVNALLLTSLIALNIACPHPILLGMTIIFLPIIEKASFLLFYDPIYTKLSKKVQNGTLPSDYAEGDAFEKDDLEDQFNKKKSPDEQHEEPEVYNSSWCCGLFGKKHSPDDEESALLTGEPRREYDATNNI